MLYDSSASQIHSTRVEERVSQPALLQRGFLEPKMNPLCLRCRFPRVVECRLPQAESGQLFRMCRDLLSAGGPAEPQGEGDSATGTAARPAKGQRSNPATV